MELYLFDVFSRAVRDYIKVHYDTLSKNIHATVDEISNVEKKSQFQAQQQSRSVKSVLPSKLCQPSFDTINKCVDQLELHELLDSMVDNFKADCFNTDRWTSLIKETDICTTKFADYQFNGGSRVFQTLKKSVTGLTLQNVMNDLIKNAKGIDDSYLKAIEKMEPVKNFINITLNNDFLLKTILECGKKIEEEGLTGSIMKDIVPTSHRKKIIIDYSSPNVAKSLHIGHLRSTIIGESITRLLKVAGHNVTGVNHIGDWGTQFGMIINYLKKVYESDQKSIMSFLSVASSDDLMRTYRNAKKMFDGESTNDVKYVRIIDGVQDTVQIRLESDSKFADESRQQTYELQQGVESNVQIWKKICEISSNEYNKIYEMLNVKNLTECGESFYREYIPEVLSELKRKDLLKDADGAKIVMLDGWTFPLIVVKSDGGYTYDTTDLSALYYRLNVLNADQIIYVTDSGQKTHFDMCFKVAERLGWTVRSNEYQLPTHYVKLTHIGFGLVCGKDGTKLKTRSGETVKMLDVIGEIIKLSEDSIRLRAKSVSNTEVISDSASSDHTTDVSTDSEKKLQSPHGYENDEGKINDGKINDGKINDGKIKDTSRKIGINTLKYFDLSHTFTSSYKYDPESMFRFNGDTGVYLMYCFARINGIIEKSSLKKPLSVRELIKQCKFDEMKILWTKETRDLMICISNFTTCLRTSINELNTNILTKYLYNLSNLFNSYITQKNGKIIGSETETFGIILCLVTSMIIESFFEILSFEKVDHI